MASSVPNRIRSLDGLRAVAISLVLLAHIPHSVPPGTAWLPAVRHLDVFGVLGVRIFFVISGFLITSLLLAELEKTSTISLRRFYFRRTLRIFPAFYTYVGAMALAASIGWIALHRHDLLAAVTYTMNYHGDRSWYLGHTWSLSVEEQFYLLWPFALRRLGVKRAVWAAGAVVACAPLVRVGTSVLFPWARLGIGETFFTVADSMAMGCLLAFFRERLLTIPRYVGLLASPFFWLVPALVCAVHLVPYSLPSWLVGETLENLGILLIIHAFIDVRKGLDVRVLNAAPVAFVGVLSYSIYLWQQPFLYFRAELPFTHFPANILGLALAALASYYLIERPFLKLRQRVERRARPVVQQAPRAAVSSEAAPL